MEDKVCPNCGVINDEADDYCQECKAALTGTSTGKAKPIITKVIIATIQVLIFGGLLFVKYHFFGQKLLDIQLLAAFLLVICSLLGTFMIGLKYNIGVSQGKHHQNGLYTITNYIGVPLIFALSIIILLI